VDVYIPKGSTPGLFTGTVTVTEGANLSYQIPVELTVRNFTLPDTPSAKTMLYLGYPDIARRYTGISWPNANSTQDTATKLIRDRHFLMAHRHKISLIDQDPGATAHSADRPRTEWISRLDGTLFTAANGYAGPGVGVGNGVYSIGTYGSWSWRSSATEAIMRTRTDAWETWFQANFPNVERFLYLIDESTNYTQTQQWASWVANNPGVGGQLPTFATLDLPSSVNNVPSLNIAATWFGVGDSTTWTNALATHRSRANHRYYQYNGKRPSQGSFATEDDGVALRELPWAQYKKGVDRWFFWESTYYNDYQGGRGQNDLFNNALTFGGAPTYDSVRGLLGWNTSNGDGVLFYPGTDTVFPADSYGVQGPIASLRLKHWRRGIQDVDYLTLAAASGPAQVAAIVNTRVPKAMWDYGISDPADPTWVRTDISWSTNPDDWESSRAALADIIEGSGLYP
jgi:hypothetical protein